MVVFFVGLSLLASTVGLVAATARPNVIVILTDDQGYGDLGCHGNPWLKTPNLDRLRAEGVSLENYHVDPVCTPTRGALMTGRYSVRNGAWSVTQGRQLLNPNEKTMADVFAASGYRTAMIGKWHLGDPFPYAPQYRGFQEVLCNRAGGVDEIGNPWGNSYFNDTYLRNGRPEKFEDYCTNVWFDDALRVVRAGAAEGAQPFFIYLPTNAMHGPFRVADKYAARFLAQGHPEHRARFYGMIENFDENLGRLLDGLRATGQERNTILVFMGDNGTAAGAEKDGSEGGYNAGMRATKGSVYEGGHRVACFVRWPEHFEAGRKVPQLTAHLDWLPTLIDLCQLSAPSGVAFDGRTIAPLLKGEKATWPERMLFVDSQADRLKPWQPGVRGQFPQFAALTEQWRLVNGELFDIRTDPGQQTDVAARHPEVVAQLLAAYGQHYADVTQGSDYTRFFLGAPEENPTRFTARDWHPTEGNVIWQTKSLADDDLQINGYWAVQVVRSGRYEIRLSRYPEDHEKAIGAIEAKIKVGEVEMTKAITKDAGSVTFTMDLSAGPALLQTWFKDTQTGRTRGAYFIQAKWVSTSGAQ